MNTKILIAELFNEVRLIWGGLFSWVPQVDMYMEKWLKVIYSNVCANYVLRAGTLCSDLKGFYNQLTEDLVNDCTARNDDDSRQMLLNLSQCHLKFMQDLRRDCKSMIAKSIESNSSIIAEMRVRMPWEFTCTAAGWQYCYADYKS